MAQPSESNYQVALRDFQHARREAVMQQLLARMRGEHIDLLDFEEVTQKLRPTGTRIDHGVREIPLDRIVGSVDRYRDFTRTFLPRRDSDSERWAGVRAAVDSMVGMRPIDVYQIGDAYFVQDGNHRVSIARRLNSGTITARVMEIKTRVPFTADDDPNEIICKANYADFLERTNLDRLRPDADLMMSFCDRYHVLLGQIERLLPEPERAAAPPEETEGWPRAVARWYDEHYLPVVRIIRELGVLRRFPKRTEADLYVMLVERRAEIEQELGWKVELESAVSGLLEEREPSGGLLDRMVESVTPTEIGPEPGLWRRQQLARQRYHHLFEHLLIPLDGTPEGWALFDYVLDAAQFDHDHILALHVVPTRVAAESAAVREMRERFDTAVREAGLEGEFAVEVSNDVVGVLVRRAAWVDCVIVNGSRPRDDRALRRISPELRRLIQQCPRPIQVRPDGTTSDYNRPMLAYDGSRKSDEALFVATYAASRRKRPLTVLTVVTDYTSADALDKARRYLTQHGITDVTYVLKEGPCGQTILDAAREYDANVLYMGGFSYQRILNLTLGRDVERVLAEFENPIWICR